MSDQIGVSTSKYQKCSEMSDVRLLFHAVTHSNTPSRSGTIHLNDYCLSNTVKACKYVSCAFLDFLVIHCYYKGGLVNCVYVAIVYSYDDIAGRQVSTYLCSKYVRTYKDLLDRKFNL